MHAASRTAQSTVLFTQNSVFSGNIRCSDLWETQWCCCVCYFLLFCCSLYCKFFLDKRTLEEVFPRLFRRSSLRILPQTLETHHRYSKVTTDTRNSPQILETHHRYSKITTDTRKSPQILETYHSYSKLTTDTRNSPQILETHHSYSKLTTDTQNSPQILETHHRYSKLTTDTRNSPQILETHHKYSKLIFLLLLISSEDKRASL